jgi:hypothetical protein
MEVKCAEPSPSVSIPWIDYNNQGTFTEGEGSVQLTCLY